MYAMSEEKLLPKIFTYRHPKTDALVPGLTVYALITIAVTFFGKGVDNVLSFSIFLDCIGMSTSAATLFILRKRKQGEQAVTGSLKKIVPFLTIIFVVSYCFVATAVVIDNPKAALTGIGLLVLFVLLYFVFYHGKHEKQHS
jgi:APA family basic amino acid/polyamine antiporter